MLEALKQWNGETIHPPARVAEQDENSSRHSLGVMYFNGQGVVQNYLEAKK